MNQELIIQKLKLQHALGCIELIELSEKFIKEGIDDKEQNQLFIKEQEKAYVRTMSDFIVNSSLSNIS